MPTIDERIVQMKFDNEQFERNVSTSMNTLAKLKQSLQFQNLGDSLKNIEIATDSLSDRLSNLETSVQKVANVFTPLGRIGQKIFDDIADRAVKAGKAVADAFTGFGDMGAGQKKYETQTRAVQTITNATGKSVTEVEKVLDKLQQYTDETSYDFAEMVSSIGKFTSVGVELEKAEKAMEGIANEAALSGANKAEANRAMYNFAQALSAGSVKLIDWKSIENANMATKEFKEELIKTAIELGTIEGKGDAVGKIMKQTKKATKTTAAEFKETEINYQSFNSTLSEGWLTSDVLIETLNRYADTSGELGDLGKRAYQAAKEALTWADAIDAVHDAVSSGWMKTYKLIFGDLDEARVWWTYVANSLVEYTDIFTSYRNAVLESWHTQGGYNKFIESAMNIWETFMDTVYGVREALSQVFPAFDADTLLAITDKVHEASVNLRNAFRLFDRDEEGNLIENRSEAMERFQNIVRGVAAQIEIVRNFIGALFDAAGRVIGMFKPLLAPIIRFWSMTSEMWQNLNNQLKDTEVYKRLSDSIVNFFGPVGNIVEKVANGINKTIDIYAAWLKVLGKQNTFSNFFEFLRAYTDGTPFGIIFDAIDTAIGIFNALKNTIGNVVDFISKKLKQVWTDFSWVTNIDEFLIVLEYYLSQIPIIGNLFKSADGGFDGTKLISIKDSIISFFNDLIEAFKNGNLIEYIKTFFSNLWDTFTAAIKDSPLQKIVKGFQIAGYMAIYAVQSLLSKIGELFGKFTGVFTNGENAKNPIIEFFADIWETIKTIPDQADKIGEKIGEIKDKIGNAIVTGIQSIKTFFANKAQEIFGGVQDTAGNFVGAIGSFFSSLPSKIMGVVWPAIGVVAVLAIKDITKSVKNVSEWIKGFGKKEEDNKDTVGDTIMKVAGSLAVLAGIAAVLAALDHDEVGRAFAMMELMLASLVGAAALLGLINKKMDGVGEIGSQMMQLAGSIAVLAVGIFMMMSVLKWAIKPENIGFFIGSLALIAGFIAGLGTIQVLIAREAAKSGNGTANSHIDGLLDMCKGIVSLIQGLAILMLVMKGIGNWGIILGAFAFVGLVVAGLGVLMYKMTELASKAPPEAAGKLEASVKGFIPMTIALLGVVFAVGKVAKMIKKYGWGETVVALAAVAAFLGGMAFIVYTLNKQQSEEEDSKKNIIRTISIVLAMVGIALAAHIFADAANKVKDVPIENLLTFLGAIVALVAVIAFVGSSAGTSGAVGIIAVAAALAAGLALIGIGIALLGSFAGAGIEAGTQAVWLMGTRLSRFIDEVSDINWDSGKKAVQFVTNDIPAMWAAIMSIDFNLFASKFVQISRAGSAIRSFGSLISKIPGDILTKSKNVITLLTDVRTAMSIARGVTIPEFITNGGLTTLGASLSNYSGLISGIEATKEKSEMAKQVALDAKDISDSISQITLADGVDVTLVNLGSALEMYYGMLNKISTNENGDVQVPTVDSQMISQAFSALAEAVPVDDIAMISSYAAGGDNDMTQMAIGINALGEALGNYGEKIGTLDSGQVQSANDVLETLAKVNRDLNPRDIFSRILGDKDKDKKSLTSFANDITALGEALGNYGTDIGMLNKDNVKNANDVLKELINVQKVLEGEDTLSKVFKLFKHDETELSNFATDVGLLGENLKAYGEDIGGLNDTAIEKANTIIDKILSTYKDLPESGGFLTRLFSSQQDLGKFATNIGDLGAGIANFAGAVSEKSFTNVDSALSAVGKLVIAFNGLDKTGGAWSIFTGEKSFGSIGSGLEELGGALATFQTSAKDVSYSEVESAFSVVERIIGLYNSLSADSIGDLYGTDKLVHIGQALGELINMVASYKTLTDDKGNLYIQSFIDVGKMIVNAIKMGFTNKEAVDGAREELKNTLESIRGASEDDDISFTSVGIAIVNQITEGIRDEDATNDVIKAILELMNRIKSEAENSIIGDVVEDYAVKATGHQQNKKTSKFGAKQYGGKQMAKSSSGGKLLDSGYTLAKSGAKDVKILNTAFNNEKAAVEENTKAVEKATSSTSEWTETQKKYGSSSFDIEDLKYLNFIQGRSRKVWEELYIKWQAMSSGELKEYTDKNGKIHKVTDKDIQLAKKNIEWVEKEAERIKNQPSRPKEETKKKISGTSKAIQYADLKALDPNRPKVTKFDRSMIKSLHGVRKKTAKRWEELYDFWQSAIAGEVKEKNGRKITEKDIAVFKKNIAWIENETLRIANQTTNPENQNKKIIDLLSKTNLGSKGEDVKLLQKLLNDTGYLSKKIDEDGNYSKETKQAVDEFRYAYNSQMAKRKKEETENQIKREEENKKTFGSQDPNLSNYYDSTKGLAGFKHTAKKGDKGYYIDELQQMLMTYGYIGYNDKYNHGTYDARTVAAVKKYQKDRGLTETGEWDSKTIEQAAKDQEQYEKDILSHVENISKDSDKAAEPGSYESGAMHDFFTELGFQTGIEGLKGAGVTRNYHGVRIEAGSNIGYSNGKFYPIGFGATDTDKQRVSELQNLLGIEETGVWDEATTKALESFSSFDELVAALKAAYAEREKDETNTESTSTTPNTSEWMESAQKTTENQNDILSTLSENLANYLSASGIADKDTVKNTISDLLGEIDIEGTASDKITDLLVGGLEDKLGIEMPDMVSNVIGSSVENVVGMLGGIIGDSGIGEQISSAAQGIIGDSGIIEKGTGVVKDGIANIAENLPGYAETAKTAMGDLVSGAQEFTGDLQTYADEFGLKIPGLNGAKNSDGKSLQKDTETNSVQAMNDVVTKAGELMGTYTESADTALANANMAAKALYDAVNGESSQSMRPVVDGTASTAQQYAFSQVDSDNLIKIAASANLVYTIAAEIQKDLARYDENNTNNNNKLLEQFNGLNDHLDAIDRDIMNTKIYLDSNAIVAGTVSKMDRALGQRHMTYSGGRR